jgi:hypothetical protein
VCFWEDEWGDEEYGCPSPHRIHGANRVSLQEARENFLAFGAVSLDMKPYVRPPQTDEFAPEQTRSSKMTDDELTTLWSMMNDALKHLAASPSEQREYLVKSGVAPELDELALELDDVIGLVPRFVETGWLSEEHSSLILAVSQKLGEMSGVEHANLWKFSALELSPEWATVRELANAARRAFINGADNRKGNSSG